MIIGKQLKDVFSYFLPIFSESWLNYKAETPSMSVSSSSRKNPVGLHGKFEVSFNSRKKNYLPQNTISNIPGLNLNGNYYNFKRLAKKSLNWNSGEAGINWC